MIKIGSGAVVGRTSLTNLTGDKSGMVKGKFCRTRSMICRKNVATLPNAKIFSQYAKKFIHNAQHIVHLWES
jgi:hypothetical protein